MLVISPPLTLHNLLLMVASFLRAIARDGGEAGGPSESRSLRTRAGREGSHVVGGYAGELFS